MVQIVQVPQTESVTKTKKYEDLLRNLAKNIKKQRKLKGLTQEDMADLGFNYRFYQKLESGKYSPNLQTLFNISVALGVEIGSLFD